MAEPRLLTEEEFLRKYAEARKLLSQAIKEAKEKIFVLIFFAVLSFVGGFVYLFPITSILDYIYSGFFFGVAITILGFTIHLYKENRTLITIGRININSFFNTYYFITNHYGQRKNPKIRKENKGRGRKNRRRSKA